MKKSLIAFFLLAFAACSTTFAQPDAYPETDPVILNRIDQWQDLKFGFMMHWGIYAQWGVVESWSICNEPWIDRKGAPYDEYKRQYQALNRTFNPTHFNPEKMAQAAVNAGMRYVVFTTKHHDGFCMFRSNETDYGVAGRECPYSRNPQPDITRAIVETFRAYGGAEQAAEDSLLRFYNVPKIACVSEEQQAAIRETRWKPPFFTSSMPH